MILRKLLNTVALLGTSVLFASSASAGLTTWTDLIQPAEPTFVDYFGSHSYTHDITGDGFIPYPGMQALSGTLQISLYDDGECNGFLECILQAESAPEMVLIQIEELDFDTGEFQFSLGDFDGELEGEALLAINGDGLLDVTIQSVVGDFWVGDSTLNVQGVPEPGMLGMMGAGLLSLAWFRRRKQALLPA